MELNLDTTSLDFKEITGLIKRSIKENKKAHIELNDNNIRKILYPSIYTEIRKRDVPSITLDSILKDKGYSISE